MYIFIYCYTPGLCSSTSAENAAPLLLFETGTSNSPLHSVFAHFRCPLLQKCPFTEVEIFFCPLHDKPRANRS